MYLARPWHTSLVLQPERDQNPGAGCLRQVGRGMSSTVIMSTLRAKSHQLTRSFSVPKMEARCSAILPQLLVGLCQGLKKGGKPLRVLDAPEGASSPAQSGKAAFCELGPSSVSKKTP